MSNWNRMRTPFATTLLSTAIAAWACPGAKVSPALAADVPATRATDGGTVESVGVLGIEEFGRLHREVQPPAGEVWRSIPWRTSILDAAAEARQSGRPILLITTNGHLLGCG